MFSFQIKFVLKYWLNILLFINNVKIRLIINVGMDTMSVDEPSPSVTFLWCPAI